MYFGCWQYFQIYVVTNKKTKISFQQPFDCNINETKHFLPNVLFWNGMQISAYVIR